MTKSARERLKILTGDERLPGRHLLAGLQDNNLGNALFIEEDQSNVRVIMGHGEDDLPSMVSLSIGYDLVVEETAANIVAVAPFATVKWGVGGASFLAYVDLFPGGIVLNLTATSYEVTVSNPPVTDPAAAAASGARIRASVAVGMGTNARPSVNPARFTEFVGTIIPNAAAIVPVPPFATAINVFTTSNPPTLSNLRVEQSYSQFNVLPITRTFSSTFDMALSTQPLVAGARAVAITNTGPADAVGVRVVFTLSI